MMNITPVVKQLLIINVIFFIGAQLILSSEVASSYFALYYFESPTFKAWQPLTHMFMHANIMHIFFNMFALYSFGSALEHFWGGKKFLFFYISCGLGAALLHTLVGYLQIYFPTQTLLEAGISQVDITSFLTSGNYGKIVDLLPMSTIESMYYSFKIPAVGASGAVYGLLVAFAFMFPNAQLGLMFIPVPIKAKYFVPGILVVDLILGLRGSSIFAAGSTGIAHFAHIGGAITGFIMMWYWKKNQFNKNRWS
jgi:membrane associated rhomboid family serine protease